MAREAAAAQGAAPGRRDIAQRYNCDVRVLDGAKFVRRGLVDRLPDLQNASQRGRLTGRRRLPIVRWVVCRAHHADDDVPQIPRLRTC